MAEFDLAPFSDPEAAARYAETPARLTPGLADLQRMTALLMAERAPDDGRILVLGAGGGLELLRFAQMQPCWSFDGVDPSGPMLDQARRTLGALAPRAALHQGYIDDAPEGPFDAACCLLTLHFVPLEQRLPTLKAVRRRLRPGAPFVVAHHSFPQDKAGKARWLSRYAAFAVSSGVPPDDARRAADAIAQRLPAVSPSRDGALLLEAGFKDVELFYCAFTFRGWVATA